MKFIGLALTLVIWMNSCSEGTSALEDPEFCTEELRPGLEIIVRDVTTDSLITKGISVVAFNSDQKEELTFIDNAYYGAYEKKGSYLLTVEGDLYNNFLSENAIVVESDICHVITETREVFLTPVNN